MTLLKALLCGTKVELMKNAGEGVKRMDLKVTDLGLSPNWMTMGKLFNFSKPQFSHLLWMRISISQMCYRHQV